MLMKGVSHFCLHRWSSRKCLSLCCGSPTCRLIFRDRIFFSCASNQYLAPIMVVMSVPTVVAAAVPPIVTTVPSVAVSPANRSDRFIGRGGGCKRPDWHQWARRRGRRGCQQEQSCADNDDRPIHVVLLQNCFLFAYEFRLCERLN